LPCRIVSNEVVGKKAALCHSMVVGKFQVIISIEERGIFNAQTFNTICMNLARIKHWLPGLDSIHQSI
jgi:hypothetical protein